MDQVPNQQYIVFWPSTVPKEDSLLNMVCFLTKYLLKSEYISKNLISLNIADIHHLFTVFLINIYPNTQLKKKNEADVGRILQRSNQN
jgi:hypothetical protein